MRPVTTTLAFVLLLALAACGPDPGQAPSRERTDAPAEQPLFATDEEALAAAEEVYREYSAIAELIATGGGHAVERIRSVSTPTWYEAQVETYREAQESGRRTVGTRLIAQFSLQSWDQDELIAYVCHDYEQSAVVDAQGNDVTPERPRFAVFTVNLVVDQSKLLVDGTHLWNTGETCSS